MTAPDPGWPDLRRVVEEALDVPAHLRSAHLRAHCLDPLHRAAALKLLRACERAETSPLLDAPAAQFAASLLHEVEAESEEATLQRLREGLVGRYTIESELGRGGMARVYLARDERHGRRVALKLLRPGLLPALEAERFRREIEFAAGLSHPHILALHDSGETGGLLYYITPYIDGESLRARLRRDGPLQLAEAVRLLRDVARALSYAHRQGVVHRDIKPANILLSQEGDALVADFGVAKALVAAQGPRRSDPEESPDSSLLGTPAYMAPEQMTGTDVDHRADLYALGVVAFELLTGISPFAGRSGHSGLLAHGVATPERLCSSRPDLPRALCSLVDQLLAKRPADRPQSASDVMGVLDHILTGLSPADLQAMIRGRSLPGRWRAPALAAVVPALLWWAALTVDRPATPTEGAIRGTADPEAYELYMKGRHLTTTRQRDGLFRALEYFDQALGRDPGFARAHAAVGDAWVFLGIFGQVPPNEAFPRARAAAERAIALDSLLAEGYATLAHVLFVYDWDWAAAEAALGSAIALDPSYPVVRMYRASLLHSLGRPDEALTELDVARRLDPLTPTALLAGRIFVDTSRPDTALRILEEQVALDPRLDLAHQLIAHARLQMGDRAGAIASMQRAAALSGARDSAQLAYVYAQVGDPAEARRILDTLVQGNRPLEPLGFHLAMAYGGLGETDEAFRWLEAAHARGGSFMNLLAVTTGFAALRSDPRFDDLLRRMALR